MSDNEPFWRAKRLDQLSRKEWEALCDGCGKCCLHKLEDADTGDVHYTNVACRLLDLDSVRCKNYGARKRFVPDCTVLTPQNVDKLDWLPETCAYRRVAKGKDIPDWHHLKTGSREAMHAGGHSVRGRIVPEGTAGNLEHHLDPSIR